jgi:PEP-CTERM/exosortase A-associated glycosyltransferase
MKILHFVNHSFPSKVDGYSIRTRFLVEAQRAAGHQPIVVTRPECPHDPGYTLGVVEHIGNIAHFHYVGADSSAVWACKQVPVARRYVRDRIARRYYRDVVLRCLPCDLFHVHMQPATLRLLNSSRRQYQIPCVYEVRGVWEDSAVACGAWKQECRGYRKTRQVSTRAAEEADWVITISEGLRREFIRRGIPADKITVVPNGVDTAAFAPLPRDQHLAEKTGVTGKTVFGYVSSIRELEGIDYLIRAMPEILKAVPSSVCLIVGDGEDKPRLESLVRELGLQDKVIFTGTVPHADVREYYSIIDVFVVPRPNQRVNNLVTPLKPLEAMAMERALLVSGVGGLTELVSDGHTGLVFAPEDAHDLASKAILLAHDEHLRLALGRQARRFVVQERDWSIVVRKYEEMSSFLKAARPSSRREGHVLTPH